jgi:hypothetical protein
MRSATERGVSVPMASSCSSELLMSSTSNAPAQRPGSEQREPPVRCSGMLGSRRSLDNLICPQQHRRWNGEAENPGCLEVDPELKLVRLLDW